MDQPSILSSKSKLLVGVCWNTSISENKAKELWENFKPRVKEIEFTIPEVFYSVQVFPINLEFEQFSPLTTFDKWAAIEVTKVSDLPERMQSMTLPEGEYAVFIHRGPVTAFKNTFNYIHKVWLPASEYQLDARPHFEILDHRYLGPMHQDSIEEVWIPITKKL